VFLSYFKGVPVLLGLFGTFWGLSQTLLNLPGIIDSISSDGSSTQTAIKTLQNALNAPLSGMATAFSCSMFGLAGSLIIGFLDLQVGRVFTTFYHKIEEKLSTLTRLSSFATSSESTAEGSGPAFSMGLLEQVVEGMAALHNQLKKSEDTRLSMAKSIQFFSEKLSEMSEYMLAHQGFSQRLAQNQAELQETLLSQSKEGAQGRNEEIIKTHIRSIDATLAKLLEESIEGRNKTTNEIRQEIRVVTRTLSAIASGQENT
jgi:hypothetical protein